MPVCSLQRSPLLAEGDSWPTLFLSPKTEMLQRSPLLAEGDSRNDDMAARRVLRASTEPPPRGGGQRAAHAARRFMVDASTEPPPRGGGQDAIGSKYERYGMLQRSPLLAEGDSRLTAGGAVYVFARFNGAPSSRRGTGAACPSPRRPRLASTEPPPRGGGQRPVRAWTWVRTWSFNGAPSSRRGTAG